MAVKGEIVQLIPPSLIPPPILPAYSNWAVGVSVVLFRRRRRRRLPFSLGVQRGTTHSNATCLPNRPLPTHPPHRYWVLVAFALLLSSLSAVGSRGITIAVEKRMPKLLCSPPPGQEAANSPQEHDRQPVAEAAQQLASMNSVFRAIDLMCLLASPMASGVLMTYCSPLVAVLALVSVVGFEPLYCLHW